MSIIIIEETGSIVDAYTLMKRSRSAKEEMTTDEFEELAKIIKAEYLEEVTELGTYNGEPAQMFADEEGLISGRPYNTLATRLRDSAHAAKGLKAHMAYCGLRGPVIILTGSDCVE